MGGILIAITKESDKGSLVYLLLEDLAGTLELSADGGGPEGEALQLGPYKISRRQRVIRPATPGGKH